VVIADLVGGIRDASNVKRVFGDAIERDGVTVIPVATVIGGGGGGGENSPEGGSGGGFGVYAKPTGVYVIRGSDVRWEPALDLNMLGLVALLILRTALKRRSRRKH